MDRSVKREVAGRLFWVPAPEERILLATLQRLYRHYHVRICDIVNTKELVDSASVDFDELRRAAKCAGIWPGVAWQHIFDWSLGTRITTAAGTWRFPNVSGWPRVSASKKYLRTPDFCGCHCFRKVRSYTCVN